MFIPVVFVLLPDKKRDSYDAMFSMLAECLESRDLQLSATYFMSGTFLHKTWLCQICLPHVSMATIVYRYQLVLRLPGKKEVSDFGPCHHLFQVQLLKKGMHIFLIVISGLWSYRIWWNKTIMVMVYRYQLILSHLSKTEVSDFGPCHHPFRIGGMHIFYHCDQWTMIIQNLI